MPEIEKSTAKDQLEYIEDGVILEGTGPGGYVKIVTKDP